MTIKMTTLGPLVTANLASWPCLVSICPWVFICPWIILHTIYRLLAKLLFRDLARFGHYGEATWTPWHPSDCLFNSLFTLMTKKTSAFCMTYDWPFVGGGGGGDHQWQVNNTPVRARFPSQISSNAESNSMSWRHHENRWSLRYRRNSTIISVTLYKVLH